VGRVHAQKEDEKGLSWQREAWEAAQRGAHSSEQAPGCTRALGVARALGTARALGVPASSPSHLDHDWEPNLLCHGHSLLRCLHTHRESTAQGLRMAFCSVNSIMFTDRMGHEQCICAVLPACKYVPPVIRLYSLVWPLRTHIDEPVAAGHRGHVGLAHGAPLVHPCVPFCTLLYPSIPQCTHIDEPVAPRHRRHVVPCAWCPWQWPCPPSDGCSRAAGKGRGGLHQGSSGRRQCYASGLLGREVGGGEGGKGGEGRAGLHREECKSRTG